MKNTRSKASTTPSAARARATKRDFFTAPKKSVETQEARASSHVQVRLGSFSIEKKAGLDLISLRLRQLLSNTPETWDAIYREEGGSFWGLFRKYHVPLLVPFIVFFFVRELVVFKNFKLFVRHIFIFLPTALAFFIGYIYLLGVIAEETAEHTGGRFTPQSGLRIALFSSLILSFMSVAAFLPFVGVPLLIFALFWHYRQLFMGARTLLHISEKNDLLYRLSIFVLWALMGLAAFFILSLLSLLSNKLGLVAI